LHNAGYIIDDMAEIMGISDRKIYRYLKNMDVERRNKYYNKEKI
jgi:transcriptional antiterminator